MKNWKTTFGGLLAGAGIGFDALMKAYESGAFTGKTGVSLVIAIGLVLLGVYSKDKNVTGGTVQQ